VIGKSRVDRRVGPRFATFPPKICVMPARTGRKHRRGTEAKRLEVAAHLVAELDGEGAVRGISCGLMADYVIELGLRALRTQKSTQESLMAS
jgi:hypothetical protein